MTTQEKTTFATAFEKEVYEGLTAFPKYLSSKFFYDKKGDKLFQEIMAMPEYYLTGCEYDIIDSHKEEFASIFSADNGFDLIELGAGDGKKTKLLLAHFMQHNVNFSYKPIDISADVLAELKESVNDTWPELDIQTQQGTYVEVLDNISTFNKRKKIIMLLGSNIGNLTHDLAVDFLKNIQEAMREGDILFMGLDQKKEPERILSAYKDSKGITEAFNKNLLKRINRELDANFDLDAFTHWPTYNPETGTTKSFLVSQKEQLVNIKSLNLEIHLQAWESIHTEISQKYDDSIVYWLAKEAGLQVTDQFADENGYFKDYLFEKASS
ncbi:L-histidine N(alpha)-methyltransferase [Flavimarina sp. Hel_I_48]|uniref:L-histidine N(alpha)-methyltransferase n=1 Tax=Flavimarina sp. Hel_I_48 TaxID=1392488 RepID=UPI0004DFC9D0|nr:L-histidine N(alpha)-methyltransferase [Flavimarina sp. Hel_I_48]